MTYSDLFSKRYRLRPTPEGMMYEEVPERARVGLYHLVEQFFGGEDQIGCLHLYQEICVALRIPRNRGLDNYDSSIVIERLIQKCEWHQFYDICEVMWVTISSGNFVSDLRKFTEEVNELFHEEQLGFELKDGKIERVGSPIIDAQIKEARYLLKEAEFESADELFEKAIKALNERPNPDSENCIKDAVTAIESVGRIIVKNEKALLDGIIKKAAKDGVIPQPLDQTIIKLYAYRGNEPGVAHGAVDISKVTVDEAELILAMSAAMIIYLVKKRGKLS